MVGAGNRIWLGGYNGSLISLDLNSQTFTRHKHSKNRTPIYAICESENGNILVGTNGEGLKSFNPRTKEFTGVDGLSGEVLI